MDFGGDKEKPNLDLNLPANEVEEWSIGLGLQESGSNFPEKQTENEGIAHDSVGINISGGELRRVEGDPDVEASDSPSKRMRFTIEDKGKAKIDYSEVNLNLDLDLSLNINLDLWKDPIQEKLGFRNLVDKGSLNRGEDDYMNWEEPGEFNNNNFFDVLVEENFVSPREVIENQQREEQELERGVRRRIDKSVAQKFAHLDPEEQQSQETGNQILREVDDDDDSQSPFSVALEGIKLRNQNLQRKCLAVNLQDSLFKWVPASNNGLKRGAPKLLDLSLNALAKYAYAIVSLEGVPDELRHKLSQLVSDARRMDAHFVELLARRSPSEIRVRDASQLMEEDLSKIFGGCDMKDLTVLQLDLCGQCMPDYVVHRTLASSVHRLHALATISLRGAHRLSDNGLTRLVMSAPTLESINLSQCSLLTSGGIKYLASRFEHTLRELYIDDCQNIDAMVILPALRKLKHLEVLSVAGIQTVTDDFVIGMVEVCGINMKELVFANCVELTDISLKIVGKQCPKLCALDLSYLRNLTDAALKCLANGCRSIHRLKFCRNGFSDEAIAAFLEASGGSLKELSLNNISRVALNTALAIAKFSGNLLSLDLSWCRKLTDEALGLIVDSCSALKLLKLFGCTQVTDVFLNGHSNSLVQIVGCKNTPVLEHINPLECHETPLRYAPLAAFGDQQSLDP